MPGYDTRICRNKDTKRNCDHIATYAGNDAYCRFCQGRTNFEQIVRLRIVVKLVRHVLGLKDKRVVRKSIPKNVKPVITKATISKVPVERVKVGATIAQHGTVQGKEKFQGRKLVGKKYRPDKHGILFKTNRGLVWYPVNSMVCVEV